MSKSMHSIFPITGIDGKYVQSKNGTYVVVQIQRIRSTDMQYIFQTICDNMETPFSFVIKKNQAHFNQYEKYFTELIQKNIHSRHLPILLRDIEKFKKATPSFSYIALYAIFPVTQEEVSHVYTHILQMLSIEYDELEGTSLEEFFDSYFL